MPNLKVSCSGDLYTRFESGTDYWKINYGKESTLINGHPEGFNSSFYTSYVQFDLKNLSVDMSKKRLTGIKLHLRHKSGSFQTNYCRLCECKQNIETVVTEYNIDQYIIRTIKSRTSNVLRSKDGEWMIINIGLFATLEEIGLPYLLIELDIHGGAGDNTTDYSSDEFYSKESGNANAPYILLEYEEIVPGNPVIYFPDDVSCRNDGTIIFNWEHQATDGFGQIKYEIDWRLSRETSWNNIIKESSTEYHEFSPGTFPVGIIEWRVRTYNACGNVSEYSAASFVSIGESDAPEITNVKNDAFTEIQWTASEDQDLFEIEIYKDGELIHESGIKIGHEVYTYAPDIMLADGVYNLKIRMTNIYGIQTEWESYQFLIKTTKPAKPDVFVNPDNWFSVRIKNINTAERCYVIRKNLETGEEDNLGVIKDNELVDYTPASGIEYAYIVRAYDNGFADSDAKVVSVKFDGAIIYDTLDYSKNVHLFLSEEEFMNIQMQMGKETTYTKCIGRVYPVTEKSEWLNEDISIKCYVKKEELEVLKKIFNKGEIILFKMGEWVFYCDIETFSATNAFLNRGYSVDISFKRISVN